MHFFMILRYISVDRNMDQGKISKKNISTWAIFGRMILKISKCRCKIENVIKKLFMLHYVNNLYPIPLGVYKHDCQRNMHAERPVFCLDHPKLMLAETQVILSCVLTAHGCVWNFWFGRSWGSNFCMQSGFYMCKQAACCVCGGDVKKIDFKPIFTVPETLSNLALFHETVKIDEAWIVFVYFKQARFQSKKLDNVI